MTADDGGRTAQARRQPHGGARADGEVLRALVRLAALVTAAPGATELIEAVAETARELLNADSLSISRLADEGTVLQTVINVGQMGAGEQRWPTNETYSVADFPDTLGFLTNQPVRHLATHVHDPFAEAAEVELLRSLGKISSLKTPIVVEGRVWGELWASRAHGRHAFEEYDGDVAGVIVGLVSAGLSQANAWEQMQHLALTDPMTGLANRRAFDEHLGRHLGRAHALRQPLALLLGDVNGLKRLNDSRGHAAGDDALLHVAAAAAAVASDVREALAARLGGDEFAVILPAVSPAAAMDLGTQWCHSAAHPGHGITLACGLAVTVFDTDSTDARELLRAADSAQYRAKATGSPVPICAGTFDDLPRHER